MKFKTADKFFENIDKYLKIYDKDTYHISYFGGEPTLNWKLIEYTLPKFFEDPKCESVVLISNGLRLNQKRVDFLKKYKCGLSLSFDGIWQDSTRPGVKSKNFEKYIELRSILSQMTDSYKVMLDPSKFHLLTENFEFFINQYNFDIPDFCLIRDDIYNSNDILNFKNNLKKLADLVIEYQHKGRLVSTGLFDLYILDTLANETFGKRDHGCFVGVSGFLYSTDGKIWPCERFRSANKFKLYDSKPIQENIDYLKDPELSNPSTYEDCLKCELYKYCNAGCTFSQIQYAEVESRKQNLKNKIEGNQENSCSSCSKAKPVKSVCELLRISYKEAFRVYNEGSQEYRDYIARRLNQSLK